MKFTSPTLTVFADASYFPDQGVAGWGGWARRDDTEPWVHGGPLTPNPDTTVLELEALAIWLQVLHAKNWLQASDEAILIQSDSLGALQSIRGVIRNTWSVKSSDNRIHPNKKRVASHQPALEVLTPLLTPREVVYLKHVKGHQGGGTPRNYVNELCDRRAKKEARAQI